MSPPFLQNLFAQKKKEPHVKHQGQFPHAFSHGTVPQQVFPTDIRSVRAVTANPHTSLYAPDMLHFPDAQRQEKSCGLPGNAYSGYVIYDNQATWDRGNAAIAGPVRSFFREMMTSNLFNLQRL